MRRIQEVETTTPDVGDVSEATRSYVCGTGYVDELVAQIEHDARGDVLYYYLQDANYNVVGITDEWGNVVRHQYTWTPCGELAATEDPAGTPPLVSRVGHQGLFFERFYAGTSESLVVNPALSPVDAYGGIVVPGVYHSRNRWYSPELGRFVSRDPNESALLIASALVSNGGAMNILIDGFAGLGHYGNGMSLYQYLGSNPVNGLDPTGLYDPFDEVDGFIADYYGERAAAANAAMEKIGRILEISMAVAQVAVQFVPGGTAVLMAGYLAVGDWEGAIQVAAFGGGLKVARLVGRMAVRATSIRASYKAGKAIAGARTSGGIGFRSFDALKRHLGSPGPGNEWHHIVEKCKAGRFGAERVHNTANVVAVPASVNSALNALYSSIRPGITGGFRGTIRQWLSTKSFAFNMQFGEKALSNVLNGVW